MAAADAPKSVYPKPVSYRLLEKSYFNGEVVNVPEDGPAPMIEYDGHPGTNLEAVCDEGRRRKAIYANLKRRSEDDMRRAKLRAVMAEFGEVIPMAPPPAPVPEPVFVPIPDDWESFKAGRLVLLASKLGAPDDCDTGPAASEFIKGVVEARAVSRAA